MYDIANLVLETWHCVHSMLTAIALACRSYRHRSHSIDSIASSFSHYYSIPADYFSFRAGAENATHKDSRTGYSFSRRSTTRFHHRACFNKQKIARRATWRPRHKKREQRRDSERERQRASERATVRPACPRTMPQPRLFDSPSKLPLGIRNQSFASLRIY